MKDRHLSPEERRAWDKVRRSVKPLAGVKPLPEKDGLPEPPASKQADKPASLPTVPPPRPTVPLLYRPDCTPGAPQDRGGERKIRKGKIEISASLDLHGHTQESAWSALPNFLRREQARGSRCVIVITGKGRFGEGVLRQNFLRWLEMPECRPLVSGYAEAHPRHGGSGAFYVFMKRR